MAYDFHGGWETAGPTNHISALFRSTCEQADGDWADKAIKAYVAGVVDPAKVVLGVPFYGHGWRTSAVGDGLCLAATGVPRGTYEKGTDDYEVLAARNAPAFQWQPARFSPRALRSRRAFLVCAARHACRGQAEAVADGRGTPAMTVERHAQHHFRRVPAPAT